MRLLRRPLLVFRILKSARKDDVGEGFAEHGYWTFHILYMENTATKAISLNKQTNPFSPCEPLKKFKPFLIPGEAISLALILRNLQPQSIMRESRWIAWPATVHNNRGCEHFSISFEGDKRLDLWSSG